MGYNSNFSGEVVINGLFLNDLEKYKITTEKDGKELEVLCQGSRSGYYMSPPEPTGFRVDESPPIITIFPGDEPEKAYGFSEFAQAVYRMWKDGHVKSAEMRREGESGDDIEHYYLLKGRWRKIRVIETSVNWKPKLCRS